MVGTDKRKGAGMTEVTNELLLEVLKKMQGRLNIVGDDVSDIKQRLVTLETYVSTLVREDARLNERLGHLEIRLNRVEQRLELSDA
jgi:regulator of replication initiation timing